MAEHDHAYAQVFRIRDPDSGHNAFFTLLVPDITQFIQIRTSNADTKQKLMMEMLLIHPPPPQQTSSSLGVKLSCLCMKIDSDDKDIERLEKDQTPE